MEELSDTTESQVLFDALRELRLKLARKQGIPPYIIFHDRTLIAMAQHKPRTIEAFGRIPGVGDVKLDRYGEAFLDVIRTHEAWMRLKCLFYDIGFGEIDKCYLLR